MPLTETPAALGFSLPAEWERHERTWMAWPCRAELWGDAVRLSRARAATARIAAAIAAFEPVVMVVRPDEAEEAARLCGAFAEIVALPLDDSWMRDIGPSFIVAGAAGARRVAGIDWNFNAWGMKYQGWAADDALAGRLLARLGMRRFAGGLVLEGGAIQSDGAGTLMTTKECLLNESRNPGLSQAEIEERLCAALGAKQVLWLPFGLEDDETDGHIDNVAAFVGPGRVVLNWTDDENDANADRMAANLGVLESWRPSNGTSLQIIRLPQPMREYGPNERRLPLSYVNFYICNGAVMVPKFGDPADGEALRILEDCFAGRTVVQLPAQDIVIGGGGIHCITHEQPAGAIAPAEGAR